MTSPTSTPASRQRVEILDITDEEARTLLLSIDPLVELARRQEPDLEALWEEAARRSAEAAERLAGPGRARSPSWTNGWCC